MTIAIELIADQVGKNRRPFHDELNHYGPFGSKAVAEGILQRMRWTRLNDEPKKRDQWAAGLDTERILYARVVSVDAPPPWADPRDLPVARVKVKNKAPIHLP